MSTPTEPVTIPETPIGERVAADLRALAELAAGHPELAEDLAQTVSMLHVVLRCSSEVGPDDFTEAAIAQGARLDTPLFAEAHYPTSELVFPHQTIRLIVTRLSFPEGTFMPPQPPLSVAQDG